jgi:serine/threonine protein kinase
LNHPNICTIYEIDECEGRFFIAMECVEGESLKARIQSGPLPLDRVIEIGVEIAGGLQEAHGKGIIHRDIKSANIMLTAAGRVKVTDFGLAKSPDRTQLTRSGTTVGTVAYMSPEQGRGDPVDFRTDIWSRGDRALRDDHRRTALQGGLRASNDLSHHEQGAAVCENSSL